MFLQMLRRLFGPVKSPDGQLHPDEYPNERLRRLRRNAERAPLPLHLRILYGDIHVGEEDLLGLVERTIADSSAVVPPLKLLHRPLASYFLAQYFLHALEIEGGLAECGVFSGTSALFMCHAARAKHPAYAGEGFHLVDSFSGLDEPRTEDLVAVRSGEGTEMRPGFSKGALAAPIDVVRHTMRAYRAVELHEGWIPAVFATLPEMKWSFVHVDVDQYAPTLACLEYFYPRLNAGGVILCDDYGAPLFPGAARAWDEYCTEHDVPFVVLDTGQSVILKS